MCKNFEIRDATNDNFHLIIFSIYRLFVWSVKCQKIVKMSITSGQEHQVMSSNSLFCLNSPKLKNIQFTIIEE